MKRDLPSSGKGGHGKGGDGPDRKKFRPAYMARSENDNETDVNKKNANKRINLKVRALHNTTLYSSTLRSISCSQTLPLSQFLTLSLSCDLYMSLSYCFITSHMSC
jgi:hypothetical protein